MLLTLLIVETRILVSFFCVCCVVVSLLVMYCALPVILRCIERELSFVESLLLCSRRAEEQRHMFLQAWLSVVCLYVCVVVSLLVMYCALPVILRCIERELSFVESLLLCSRRAEEQRHMFLQAWLSVVCVFLCLCGCQPSCYVLPCTPCDRIYTVAT